MRDNQQARLYRAEAAWRGKHRRAESTWDFFRVGRTEEELTDFIVGTLAPIAKKLGLVKKVGDARPKNVVVLDKLAKRSWAGVYARNTETIMLDRGAGTSHAIAMHELAHHLTTDLVPAHGAEFARAHLGLVRATLGAELAQSLEDSYVTERVIFRGSHQQAAAWKQVIRLRSDRLAQEKRGKVAGVVVPVTNVIVDLTEAKLADWSEAVTTAKFSGSLARLHVNGFFASSVGGQDDDFESIVFHRVRAGDDLKIHRHALRYVEGPMVRAR